MSDSTPDQAATGQPPCQFRFASQPSRDGFRSMIRLPDAGNQLFDADRAANPAKAKRSGERSGFRNLVQFSSGAFQVFGPQRLRDRATGPTALAVTLSPQQFSAALEGADLLPVRLFARSVGVAIHPAYAGGAVYHDFAGMTVARGKLVIDWAHGDSIGYFDSYQLVPGVGLYLNGMLELNGENAELARHVASQLSEGVPLESSISTDRRVTIEEVEEFSVAHVNGLTAQGPCAIVRKWTLLSVAVCPHGTDSKTRTELVSAGA